MESLVVRGATQHNLKSVSCDLPRNQLVVITGPSGSGKSSLAFDTIYAEGQRRYVESLSAYARQFLDQLPKPRVESIEGLSPAIAIEQKGLGKSPRSTVGTVTEIADYLRLLYARIGVPHCPSSSRGCSRSTARTVRAPPATAWACVRPSTRLASCPTAHARCARARWRRSGAAARSPPPPRSPSSSTFWGSIPTCPGRICRRRLARLFYTEARSNRDASGAKRGATKPSCR